MTVLRRQTVCCTVVSPSADQYEFAERASHADELRTSSVLIVSNALDNRSPQAVNYNNKKTNVFPA